MDSPVAIKMDKAHVYAETWKNTWIIVVGEQKLMSMYGENHHSIIK